MQLLWSNGRTSWVEEKNLPKKIVEIMEREGSYQVKTNEIKEFGQRRGLLEVLSGDGDEAKVMERLVYRVSCLKVD